MYYNPYLLTNNTSQLDILLSMYNLQLAFVIMFFGLLFFYLLIKALFWLLPDYWNKKR